MLSVGIIYRPGNARPLMVGETADRLVLRDAAISVMAKARESAEALAAIDPVLSRIQSAEADKLEAVLGLLIPFEHEGLPA